jgi:hypothetical protein
MPKFKKRPSIHWHSWKWGYRTLCEWMPEYPGEFYEYWNGYHLGFIVIVWHTQGKQETSGSMGYR